MMVPSRREMPPMLDSSSGVREPVELLAEEFLERRRRGERPSLEEYVARYPDLAEEIRDVFPALVVPIEGKLRDVAPASSRHSSAPLCIAD